MPVDAAAAVRLRVKGAPHLPTIATPAARLLTHLCGYAVHTSTKDSQLASKLTGPMHIKNRSASTFDQGHLWSFTINGFTPKRHPRVKQSCVGIPILRMAKKSNVPRSTVSAPTLVSFYRKAKQIRATQRLHRLVSDLSNF